MQAEHKLGLGSFSQLREPSRIAASGRERPISAGCNRPKADGLQHSQCLLNHAISILAGIVLGLTLLINWLVRALRAKELQATIE